jgi:hypothetical protein
MTRSLFAALLLCTARCSLGCTKVTEFQFQNRCSEDVWLSGWNHVVKKGETYSTTQSRPSGNRISWRYASSSGTMDFIELNTYRAGPGSPLCGHPSYSTYNGFNMGSKYEALTVSRRRRHYACLDPGAQVDYTAEGCPSGSGNGYLCKGDRRCDSAFGKYVKKHSWALNHDLSKTHQFTQSPYGKNYVNFWCSEEFGFHELVATMIDCRAKGSSIVLKVTSCPSDALTHNSTESEVAESHVGNGTMPISV